MGPASKKLKLDDKSEKLTADLVEKIKNDRKECAESVMEFKFNKSRVRILSFAKMVEENAKGIVYWMYRDQRVQDNWALLYAQKLALKNKIPLHVCFCLITKCLDATLRHYDFLLKGLEFVEAECNELGIRFHVLCGAAPQVLPQFVTKHGIGAVVTDFSPLREPAKWVENLKEALPEDVPLCQVDAHNIVPCWEASPVLEYAARTIRTKINSKLPDFLTQFPPVITHPYEWEGPIKKTDWKALRKELEIDDSVPPVEWATAGYKGGINVLQNFMSHMLKDYHSNRNDPNKNNLSNLSPWFHFGQISVQRAILCVQEYKSKYPQSVAAFCEEAIIRRELADNFCFYNENYDTLEGSKDWAKKTLDAHRKDKRTHVYTLKELEKSKSHDDLWNAAQNQLVRSGKMHGFLRMYWAKKILEWSNTPEEALIFAIYLNDKYSLDGRDPNGYVGCMWSICGVHDQGWAERKIFGKIRYMNYEGCKRKFDVNAFVAKWRN